VSRRRAKTSSVLALALVLVPVAGGVTRAGAVPPRGVLGGTPHTVRLRPVVGEVGPAPRRRPGRATRATRAARLASSAAVAACDPSQVGVMRAAPDATAGADPAGACVLSGARGAPRSRPRQLLGPAGLSGNDVASVNITAHGRRRYALALRVVGSREQTLDAFVAAHFHQRAAVTLDGDTVAIVDLQPDASQFTSTEGRFEVAPSRGFSETTAHDLRDAFGEARDEQLVGLLQSATMTRAARAIVASVTASVDDRSQFVSDCRVREVPNSVVLGCFGHETLRVLQVDRPDLAPVMVVSAAHEMLHGAYLQLGRRERHRIDDELERVYSTIDDPELSDLVAEYAEREPGQRDNELHSLLGTQVRNLSPRLERYYRRYFRDREAVVGAFESYHQIFTALEQRHDALRAQLDALDAQLDDLNHRYDDAKARAVDLRGQIESLRAQGRIGESNDLVPAQNAAADEVNALVDQGVALEDQYDAVVTEYNAVVSSAHELYDAISAVPPTAPTS
jgi:predicted  nucleic acid-binding Zn-ribbon protein